ncbi:hypothetical protein JCM10296v2_001189 [Rhodotorula toruloides]
MPVEVGATYGIAVRLPSFIAASAAYEECKHTLGLLDVFITRSRYWRSKGGWHLGIWTRIRRHLLDNALDLAERDFLANYLRLFDCGCSEDKGLTLPTKLREVGWWWAMFECGHPDTANYRDMMVNMKVKDRLEDVQHSTFLRPFNLTFDATAILHPDRLNLKSQHDLEMAILVSLPLHDPAMHYMEDSFWDEDELYSDNLPTYNTPFEITDSNRSTRHCQLAWKGFAAADTPYGNGDIGRPLANARWRFKDAKLGQLPPRWMGVTRLGTYFGLEVDLSPIRPQTLVQGYDSDHTLDSAVLLQLPIEGNWIDIETYTGIELTRKLVRYFSLDYEGRIVFNPVRLAEGNHRDLETAVLLTVPLKHDSTYGMAASAIASNALLRTFTSSQWMFGIARCNGRNLKSGKRSKTATRQTVPHSSGGSGIVGSILSAFGT